MNPHAIIIFSGGVMPLTDGNWRSTTYDEVDTFGTLGGKDRVEAGALLAKKYPGAFVVTTCQRMDHVLPTLASTYALEAQKLEVSPERIVKEETSVNTGTSIQEVLKLAQAKGWKELIFVSSEFQIPRIQAFYEEFQKTLKVDVHVTFIPSESVLIENDPSFAERFAKIKETEAYKTRLAAEARGIEAIKAGKYRPAAIEDKKERPA